jgi:hypothetical protein
MVEKNVRLFLEYTSQDRYEKIIPNKITMCLVITITVELFDISNPNLNVNVRPYEVK